MILIVRGIIWYGFYLFLILLPLVTAALAQPARAAALPGRAGGGRRLCRVFAHGHGVCADLAHQCRSPTVWRGLATALSQPHGHDGLGFHPGPSHSTGHLRLRHRLLAQSLCCLRHRGDPDGRALPLLAAGADHYVGVAQEVADSV